MMACSYMIMAALHAVVHQCAGLSIAGPFVTTRARHAVTPVVPACRLCSLGDDGRGTTIYKLERYDGCGERAVDATAMAAVAAQHNVRFGGVLGNAGITHGLSCNEPVSELLGAVPTLYVNESLDRLVLSPARKVNIAVAPSPFRNGKPADVLVLAGGAEAAEFKFTTFDIVDSPSDLKARIETLRGHQIIVTMGETHMGYGVDLQRHGDWDEYMSDAFLRSMWADQKRHLAAASYFQRGAPPKIAMHVRKGDIGPGMAAYGRLIPDDVNYKILETLRQLFPRSTVHLFSSTDGRANYTSQSFDGYRSRGAQVHIDGDVREDWAHFIVADILILASSAYSLAPAWFNPHCVFYPEMQRSDNHLSLEHWYTFNANPNQQDATFWSNLQTDLMACRDHHFLSDRAKRILN